MLKCAETRSHNCFLKARSSCPRLRLLQRLVLETLVRPCAPALQLIANHFISIRRPSDGKRAAPLATPVTALAQCLDEARRVLALAGTHVDKQDWSPEQWPAAQLRNVEYRPAKFLRPTQPDKLATLLHIKKRRMLLAINFCIDKYCDYSMIRQELAIRCLSQPNNWRHGEAHAAAGGLR